MSKRNLMKSIIAVIVACFILSLSSCKKEEEKIIGKWTYYKYELKELVCSDADTEAQLKRLATVTASYVSALGTVEFTKEGKVISQRKDETATGTYTLKDNKLTMSLDKEHLFKSLDCSFPKKNTMQWEVNLLEEERNEPLIEMGVTKYIVRMTLKKPQ